MSRIASVLCLVCLVAGLVAQEPVAAPAATAGFARVEIANALARVLVSTHRASIDRIELLDVHPVDLPRHLPQDGSEVGAAGKDGRPALAVLSAFEQPDTPDNHLAGANQHSWLLSDGAGRTYYGLDGSRDVAPWQVVGQPVADQVTLAYTGVRGLRYELTYRMAAGRPEVLAQLTVRNPGAGPITLNPALVPLNGIHQDYAAGEQAYAEAVVHRGGADGGLTSKTLSPGLSWPIEPGADWIALRSRFFAAFFRPLRSGIEDAAAPAAPALVAATGPGATGPGSTAIAAPAAQGVWNAQIASFVSPVTGAHQGYAMVSWSPVELRPGAALVQEWSLTATALRKADRARLDATEQRIEFTSAFYKFFQSLTKILTWMLDFIYSLVFNYGVAVVVLTILVKALLLKLTFKQHESMLKMQKLAPELKYLQEQYKDNKQAMAQKQMELWKKHGVNPLGGCLPMLVQIPIFIALFQAFQYSADMRGTGFLWVHDLTLPDQIWGMPLSFLGGWVLSLNPLPIIYIGVSAWMSFHMPVNTGGDPTQEQMAKMMRWLPVVFGLIFYNMPSGLVLYFTVNAVLSTIEVKWIRHRLGMATAAKPA